MKHAWYIRTKHNVILPDEWRCSHCPAGSFSAHLLDEESECPQTGAPDYDAQDRARIAQLIEEARARRIVRESGTFCPLTPRERFANWVACHPIPAAGYPGSLLPVYSISAPVFVGRLPVRVDVCVEGNDGSDH